MTLGRRLQRAAHTVTSGGEDLLYGSVPVGAASYAVPSSNVIWVSPSGNDANSGTQAAPKRTIKAAATAAVNGTTIILRAGSYYEGSTEDLGLGNGVRVTVPNVTIQNAPGEEAWFDGSEVVTGWSPYDGNKWRVPFVWALYRSPTQVLGETSSSWGSFMTAANPIAHWPEMVIINGVQLKQVQTLAEVGPGRFFVEGALTGGSGTNKHRFTSSHYVIGDNPAGKEVRIAKLCRGLSSDRAAANLQLRGIGVRYYADAMTEWGVFYLDGPRPTLENCVFRDISDKAIHIACGRNESPSLSGFVMQHITMERIGRSGLHGEGGVNTLIEYCWFEATNYKQFNYGPDAGAMHMRFSNNYIVRHCWFKENRGNSVWLDGDCFDTFVHGNWFVDNYGIAALAELAFDYWVVDNVFINNGLNSADMPSDLKPHHNPPFRNIDTDGFHAWHNTIINAELGFSIGKSDRDHDVSGNNIGNNVFIQMAGLDQVQSAYVSAGDQLDRLTPADFDMNFRGNLYTRPDGTHPNRFANIENTSSVCVYFGLDSTPSVSSWPQTWRQLTGETGVYTTQPTNNVVNTTTGQLLNTYGVTPATVPAIAQALRAQSLFTQQSIGAGYRAP